MNRKQALCLFLVLSFAFGDTVSLNSIVKNHQLGINPCPPRRLMGMGKRIAIVIICRIEIGPKIPRTFWGKCTEQSRLKKLAEG